LDSCTSGSGEGLVESELAPWANILLGDLFQATEDGLKAAQHYRTALRKQPLALEAVNKLVDLGITSAEIVRTIQRSIESHSLPLDDDVVWIRLYTEGLYQERNMNYEDAIKSWKQLEAHFPGSFVPLLHLGESYLALEDLEESYFYFKKAHLCDETNLDGMGHFATCVRQHRSKEELNGLAYKLLSIDDLRPEPWVAVALYSESCGDRDKALGYIARALELCPDYLLAYNIEGSIHFALGNWELAIRAFTQAIDVQKNFVSYKGLTEACLKSGKHQPALQHAKAALSLLPHHPRALVLVGNVILETIPQAHHRSAAHLAKAKKAFHRALQHDPQHIEAILAMAECFANSGEIDQGLELLKKSLFVHNSDALHAKIADFYTVKEDYTRALQHYHTATSLNPANASAVGGLDHLDKMLRRNDEQQEYDDSNANEVSYN